MLAAQQQVGGNSDLPARPDTLIADYVYYYGREGGRAYYFVRSDDGWFIIPRLFPDFNAALRAVNQFEARARDFLRYDDLDVFLYDAEMSIIYLFADCPACKSEGCVACA